MLTRGFSIKHICDTAGSRQSPGVCAAQGRAEPASHPRRCWDWLCHYQGERAGCSGDRNNEILTQKSCPGAALRGSAAAGAHGVTLHSLERPGVLEKQLGWLWSSGLELHRVE